MSADEQNIAIREATESRSENIFFNAFGKLDTQENRSLFDRAFTRGWHAAVTYMLENPQAML